jgi:endo-1,4-beta-mannosidase
MLAFRFANASIRIINIDSGARMTIKAITENLKSIQDIEQSSHVLVSDEAANIVLFLESNHAVAVDKISAILSSNKNTVIREKKGNAYELKVGTREHDGFELGLLLALEIFGYFLPIKVSDK